MRRKNQTPDFESAGVMQQPKKKKKGSGLLGRIIRRFFLVLFTIVILAVVALVLVMNVIFKGPSPAARELLTMSLLEPSATKWIPGLFLGDEMVDEIRNGKDYVLAEEVTNTDMVTINKTGSLSGDSNEFANFPDTTPAAPPMPTSWWCRIPAMYSWELPQRSSPLPFPASV